MSTNPPIQTHPTGDRREELERIKAAKWPKEGEEERIRQALESLKNLPRINLDPEIVRQVLEDPDNEYYD